MFRKIRDNYFQVVYQRHNIIFSNRHLLSQLLWMTCCFLYIFFINYAHLVCEKVTLLKLIYDETPFGAIEAFKNINSGFVEFLLCYVNILKGQLRISITTTLSCKPIKCCNAVLQSIFN